MKDVRDVASFDVILRVALALSVGAGMLIIYTDCGFTLCQESLIHRAATGDCP